MLETIALSIIGSGVLSTIVSAIITAIANRKSRLKTIEQDLNEIKQNQRLAEKDALRTQLLVMISDYPDEKTEILKLAQHYFKDLEGNWTATAIFNRWLEEHGDGAKPEWFKD